MSTTVSTGEQPVSPIISVAASGRLVNSFFIRHTLHDKLTGMGFPSAEALAAIVAPVVAAKSLDLEDIRTVRSGKKSQVVVAVDADSSPSSDQLEALSQELSSLFDAAEQAGELNFGPGYTLEVTTRGVDVPLTQPRHWRRNRGRLVRIGNDLWRIGAVSEDGTEVALVTARTKNPKLVTRPVVELAKAVVEIEFNQPAKNEAELAAISFEEALLYGAGER